MHGRLRARLRLPARRRRAPPRAPTRRGPHGRAAGRGGAGRGAHRGAVQVPPSGEPVVFLADHPTTGGYPVCAVVVPASLPLLAQLVPGQGVRLRPTRR
ncbi:hypothetical protein [Janibacter melonis]|uniref:hypothetical protein n=1 Tax=Janibacter melonis TaxID=262209 RepID=UPI0022B71B57|nr:hypothetical protein [Janibacter melonis]